jgi:hypothetical protein
MGCKANAVAVGRLLNLMGLSSARQVSDLAVAAGFGARRWDGERFFIDWHRDRVVEAIRFAVASPDNPEAAGAFEKAVARQEAKERLAECRRQKEEVEAALRRRREAELDGLKADLAALMASDPDMPIMDAIEFVTPDPGDRLELYRSFRDSKHVNGPDHNSTVAGDLALLNRRAVAEGLGG